MNAARLPLVFIAMVVLAGCDKVREALPWQGFTVAASSMEPTFRKGDRVMAESVKLADLRRGEVVFVRSSRGDTYIVRLAAIPSDRIAMVHGRVVLNGQAIAQRPVGTWRISDPFERDVALLSEHFPGERGRHRVLDDGPSAGDEMAEVVLGDDQYFVLGDNRDNAADSRYPGEMYGLGVIGGEDILRRLSTD